jgi:hypothetical protein
MIGSNARQTVASVAIRKAARFVTVEADLDDAGRRRRWLPRSAGPAACSSRPRIGAQVRP